MSSELKPCPFCGGEADVFGFCGWRVGCETRGCYGSIGNLETIWWDTKEEAIAAWNQRWEPTCEITAGRMSALTNRDTLILILENIPCKEISFAMRNIAEYMNEPASHFNCNGECNCGYNCGEDDDCFACAEKDNIGVIKWVSNG